MSVKVKDRNKSKQECLLLSHKLVHQILILTHPREFSKDGKQIHRPGILGEGQPLQAFGLDILKCGKTIHANCFQACEIYLKDNETLTKRTHYHKEAIKNCDSILRQLDLCIFEYGERNKKKRKSFEYVARITKSLKNNLYDRVNRDNLIYLHQYSNNNYRRFK